MASDGAVDFSQLESQLEQQELESPGGVATPQIYGQLLAIYLLKNDTTNAKFLWKRIPQAIKTANSDLALIWAAGQKLWQRDFPGTYEALNKEWSDILKPIMTAATEDTRRRAINLVAQAYSSISADDFAAFVGLPVTEAVQVAVKEGWTADAQSRLITPKKPERPADPVIPNEQQLSRLTDFVSFMEN